MTSVRQFLLVFSIVAAAFAVHSFMLSGSFKTLDDRISIIDNQQIHRIDRPADIFTSSFFGRGAYYRPLVTYSFALEYHFFGLNPLFYHLDNLLIHIAVSLVVFALLCRLLSNPAAAFFSALIYAIHPVHWEAIANVPGRAILLCAFFYLSSFLFFLKSIQSPSNGKINPVFYSLSLASFALALLSKESAAMLPAVLFLYQLLINRHGTQWQKRLILVLPFFVATVVYLVIRKMFGVTQIIAWDSARHLWLGFFTFLCSLLTHIRVLIFPTGLYYDRAVQMFSSFFQPGLFVVLAVWSAVLVGLIRFRKKISALPMFLILWFFVEFLPVSQLFASIGVQPGFISTADHFLYIPAVPAVALIVLAVRTFAEKNKTAGWISSNVLRCSIGAYIVFLAILTVSMNIQSVNERVMFENSLLHNPHNARVRNSLAFVYVTGGKLDEAERQYSLVIADDPVSAVAQTGLGRVMQDEGKLWAAVDHYDSIRAKDPKLISLIGRNRGEALRDLEQKYLLLLKQQPDNIQASYSLGVVYAKSQRFDEAIKIFQKVLAADPRHHNAVFNLAASYFATGRLLQAEQFYGKFLTIAPDDDPLKETARKTLQYLKKKNRGEKD